VPLSLSASKTWPIWVGGVLAWMVAAERAKQSVPELRIGAGDKRADETFPALEVMKDGGMRNTDVPRDVLKPEPFGPLFRKAGFRGIEDQTAGFLRRAADPLCSRLFGRFGGCGAGRGGIFCNAGHTILLSCRSNIDKNVSTGYITIQGWRQQAQYSNGT